MRVNQHSKVVGWKTNSELTLLRIIGLSSITTSCMFHNKSSFFCFDVLKIEPSHTVLTSDGLVLNFISQINQSSH